MQLTEETHQEAVRQARQNKDNELSFNFPRTAGGEVLSRWEMQKTPPDILITNTSMLSTMLVREVDDPIFEQTRQWIERDPDAYFYLILDELHLQRGTAGTEVSYLLKHLINRLGLDQENTDTNCVFWPPVPLYPLMVLKANKASNIYGGCLVSGDYLQEPPPATGRNVLSRETPFPGQYVSFPGGPGGVLSRSASVTASTTYIITTLAECRLHHENGSQ
nr:hypothetical protein KXZ65_00185 [Pectobacterium sp. PL152]